MRILEFKYYSFEENKLFIRLNSFKDFIYISELKNEPIIKHCEKAEELVETIDRKKKDVESGIAYYVFTDIIIYYCILKDEAKLDRKKKVEDYCG